MQSRLLEKKCSLNRTDWITWNLIKSLTSAWRSKLEGDLISWPMGQLKTKWMPPASWRSSHLFGTEFLPKLPMPKVTSPVQQWTTKTLSLLAQTFKVDLAALTPTSPPRNQASKVSTNSLRKRLHQWLLQANQRLHPTEASGLECLCLIKARNLPPFHKAKDRSRLQLSLFTLSHLQLTQSDPSDQEALQNLEQKWSLENLKKA